ncbi:MAG: hypothetical protein WCW03_01265 [Candidatus Paceibacterota bacterium]|jgi:hypothetical protein
MNKENIITDKNNLTKKDLELIEHILYKSTDEVAVAIGRSFERLEERMDAIESRIYSRLADIEDKMYSNFEELEDKLDIVKEEKQHDTNTKS